MDNDEVKVEEVATPIPESAKVESTQPTPTEIPIIQEGEIVEKASAEKVEEKVAEKKEEDSEEQKRFTVRSNETGDKVYLVENNVRHWIKNPATLQKLGFYLGQEKNFPFAEILKWPEGDSLDLTYPESVVPEGVSVPEGITPSPVTPETSGTPPKSETPEPTKPYKVWS